MAAQNLVHLDHLQDAESKFNNVVTNLQRNQLLQHQEEGFE